MPDFYWGLGGTQLQTSFSFLKEEKKKKVQRKFSHSTYHKSMNKKGKKANKKKLFGQRARSTLPETF